MINYVNEFVKSVKMNYDNVNEDQAIDFWIELVDEMIENEIINDEDEMEFDADELMLKINAF